MKVYITENIENIIDGYGMVPIIYGKIDSIEKYPDNSLTEIIAIDALDSIPVGLLDNFIQSIVKKMRMGCITIFGGVELGLIIRNIINGRIDSIEFNNIISSKKALYQSNDIIKIIQKYNLNLDTVNIRGNNYEITVSRPQNKN